MTDLTELRTEANAGVNHNLRLAHYALEAADEIEQLRKKIEQARSVLTKSSLTADERVYDATSVLSRQLPYRPQS